MEDQVMVIFAGTNRYLDGIEVAQVSKWEEQFLAWVKGAAPAIPETIRTSKQLDADTETQLKAALENFNRTFKA
jgi:F-type H+-transporting ATPase subunit alpha